MLDVYMMLIFIACFGLFYGFLAWCGSVVDPSGGERP